MLHPRQPHLTLPYPAASLMKWFYLFCLVIFVGAATLFAGRQPPPLEGKVSAALLVAGLHQVDTLDLSLRDESRPTDANGKYPVRPGRDLPSTVWFPADGGNYPLIVSSHGFSSLRFGANYIARALAQLGYVVIAADYPMTNFFAKGGPKATDVINQPADIRFLIDRMLAFSEDPAHALHGKIDPQRIGAMGISLGGMTSTMAGFDPHRRDPRIRAVASIAGPSMMFGPKYFEHNALPFLMIATPTDAVVNYQDNARPILERVPGATLVTLDNMSHTGFASMATYMRWMRNPDFIGCAVVLNNLGADSAAVANPQWYRTIGSEEDGVIASVAARVCQTDPLPETMNPIRQHWLTLLAVTSFFEMQFSADDATRTQRQHYLMSTLQTENIDVHVESARTPLQQTPNWNLTASTTQMADDRMTGTP